MVGGREEDQNNSKINLSELNTCGVHCVYHLQGFTSFVDMAELSWFVPPPSESAKLLPQESYPPLHDGLVSVLGLWEHEAPVVSLIASTEILSSSTRPSFILLYTKYFHRNLPSSLLLSPSHNSENSDLLEKERKKRRKIKVSSEEILVFDTVW